MMQCHAERPSLPHRGPLGLATSRRRSGRRCTSGLGEGRAAIPRHLPRPADRQGGERHRGRLHRAQDPRDREGPGDRGDAGRHRPSLRGQAPADRHRLLRDLQPRQRRAGRRARMRRSSAITPRRHPHARRRSIALDIIVFATGFDAHDRPAAAHGHPRPRRRCRCARPGRRGRAPISACRWRASRTCSPSPGPAAPPCSATCRSRSSSMSSGSPTASRTCARMACSASSRRRRRWTDGWRM